MGKGTDLHACELLIRKRRLGKMSGLGRRTLNHLGAVPSHIVQDVPVDSFGGQVDRLEFFAAPWVRPVIGITEERFDASVGTEKHLASRFRFTVVLPRTEV